MASTSTRRRGGARQTSFLPASASRFLKRRMVELLGLALAALGVASVVAMVTYDPSDPSWNTAATAGLTANLLGPPGAVAADILLQSVGAAAMLVALALIVWGFRILRHLDIGRLWVRAVGTVLATGLAAIALTQVQPLAAWPVPAGMGGATGNLSMDWILSAAGSQLAPGQEIWIAAAAGVLAAAAFLVALGLSRSDWALAWGGVTSLGGLIGRGARAAGRARPRAWTTTPGAAAQRDADERLVAEPELPPPPPLAAEDILDGPIGIAQPTAQAEKPARAEPLVAAKAKPPAQGRRAASEKQARLGFADSDFKLPPLDLLHPVDASNRPKALSPDALRKNAEILEGVLGDFGVKGDIVRVNPGPVVTLYELEPAPGTKSSRVINLSDDIARSMSAISVRVAVVPGRNVIGIELPNAEREMVFLRELLASKAYEKDGGSLPLLLGKDIAGTPITADLSRMPHLLVAGTTGSGKSVAMNTMILSLLYRLPPQKVRMIMIDPKMLELSIYDNIPHLLSPVVTDPKKAVVALKWAVREMEDRYRSMSKLGVRNIDGYNQRLREARKKKETLMRRVQTGFDPDTGKPIFEDQPLDLTELPHIVILVDEMADLMLVAGKEIEAAIQRLAQMARAAGLHLIMATQRPSVDVITGTIKANFPTRISFQVTSKIDSRTILGEMGAEQLLGQGDMLYMAGGGRITRVHGPFVSDEEVEQVVAHLKAQGEPTYDETILEEDEGPVIGEGNGRGNGGDELYDQAVALVAREGKASTSFIQRHLQIGYNRAARIIEQMEQDGVVSQANHVGKREVLIGSGGA